MKPHANRLPPDTVRLFAGTQVDRTRPIWFRLDGRQYSAFWGDTVLSALIAARVDTLGTHNGSPLGLTLQSAPAIVAAGASAERVTALSMARTPALENLDLVTLGPRRAKGLGQLFFSGRSLGLALDAQGALDEPWRKQSARSQVSTDLIVVGGGVAGLAAALAGARSGLGVVLLEAQLHLGGHSGLFGRQDGEDAPEDSMARLAQDVRSHAAIQVVTGAHVFALRPGKVRAHVTDLSEVTTKGAVTDFTAPRIVLATGTFERLPVFGGNRLPGVVGALEAFELAFRYGIWPGQKALVATSSSPAYRLAVLARDAQVSIDRMLDSRPHPASRFIEFSKAYGIRQFPGTWLGHAETVSRGGGLAVHLGEDVPVATDRLVVSGGWQPDLTLWHLGGGPSAWSTERNRLEPFGQIEGVALAGGAAGYFTRLGCIQSGADAVDQLLGRPRRPIEDPLIDPLYESADGPSPISPATEGPPSYLDGGHSLLERPQDKPPTVLARFLRMPKNLDVLAQAPQPLTLGEVAAGVDLGLIPPPSAGIIAAERVALVPLATPGEASPAPAHADLPLVPAYLQGRFQEARVRRVLPIEARTLDTGALIFSTPDERNPLLAVGVVIRQQGPFALALVSASAPKAVIVRDSGREVPSRLEELPE
ncbi:FAD-dependent oxidoreductase [Devosia sp. PTR5]|uniref:FAD-dependent oxidoreductase n=1 Tax=Devosia oryzisoli TaxID=2774138 RepID=A0A927FSB6_9HYPH|nr:FAD-dependent oxidoreductase [Devosia oryzisoli]MBD8065320.1 FAD-dependent oxidoreductase [Devosia oryzisoli]